MIAHSLQLPSTDRPALPSSAAPGVDPRVVGVLVGLMAFLSFNPYIGLPLGTKTAVQIGTFLSIAMFWPLLFSANRRGPLWIVPILVAPLVISMFKVQTMPDGDMVVCFKDILVWGVSFVSLLSAQMYAPRYNLQLLTGIAIATIIHTLVGIWQMYSFQHGVLPMTWIYVNQSFLSVQDNADTIAKYTQRPFGIFPEPSAMSSSLAPYLLFWIAEMCGLVKLKQTPARWQRVLFAIAVVGGISLIIISRSGHAAITVAAGVLFIAIWFTRCRATPRAFLALILVFGVALPAVLYFAAESLGDRLGGKSNVGNSSWEDRSNSIKIGFHLLVDGDLSTLIVGYGPGQTSPYLDRVHGLEAVWSVSLTYLYETGMVGILAAYFIAHHMVKVWKRSGFSVVYAAIVVVWLVGITITTSYIELLTIWIAFGWLTVWPTFCEPATASKPIDLSTADASRPKPLPRLPRPGWTPDGWREPSVELLGLPAEAAPTAPAAAPADRPRRWSEL